MVQRIYINEFNNVVRVTVQDVPTPCPLDAGEVCLAMVGDGPIKFPQRWPSGFSVPAFAQYDETAENCIRAMTQEEQDAFIAANTETVTRDPSLVYLEQSHNALLAALGLAPLSSNAAIAAALETLKTTNFEAATEIMGKLSNVDSLLTKWRINNDGKPDDVYTDPHWAEVSYEVVPTGSWQ